MYTGPESPPAAFHASLTTANMITFQWKQPNEPNGIITHFHILCFDTHLVHSVIMNGSQNIATLSGLMPYTNYFCSITAHTSVGGGPAVTISVTTEEDGEFSFVNTSVTNFQVLVVLYSSQWTSSKVLHL